MAIVNCKIPSTGQAFYSAAQRTAILASLAQIRSRYQAEIKSAADLCNVRERIDYRLYFY